MNVILQRIFFLVMLSAIFANTVCSRVPIHWQICSHIHQREQLHPDAYCFYHGLSKEAFIAALANTYLDHFVYGTPLTDDFIKVRHENDLYLENESIANYINKNVHDRHEPYKSHLLAVNLSFPGNVHNTTESALDYFKRDYNDASTAHLFEKIAQMYAATKGQADNIIHVLRSIYYNISDYRTGVVLQIIIPKDIATTCVYISTGCGIPYTQARNNPAYSVDVLESYQRDQQRLHELLKMESPDFHACGLQARIRLDHDIFSEPGNVSVRAYHAFNTTVYSDMYHQLENIIYN